MEFRKLINKFDKYKRLRKFDRFQLSVSRVGENYGCIHYECIED